MKSITTQELLRLAQVQNPKTELDKMSYAEISAIEEKLEKIIHLTRDCRLFSILLEFKHNLVIYEESKRQRELEKIKELSSLEEILSYVEHTEKSERVIICV
jgi:hypothetical protein